MTGIRSVSTIIAAGAAVGAVCAALALLPVARDLEQEGLRWLFNLRGTAKPPEDVVLVLMSQQAASRIFLPRDGEGFHRCRELAVDAAPASHISIPPMPSRWPRCLHAQLVDKLSAAGASVIAFDVLFRPRPPLPGASGDLNAWQDENLAAAFSASGRVLIAQKLETVDGQEVLAEISPAIEQSVLGSAPFPVVAGAGRRLDRFMAFEDSDWAMPTLPVVALQAHLMNAYPALAASVARHAPDEAQLIPVSSEDPSTIAPLQTTCRLMRHIVSGTPMLAEQVRADIDSSGNEPSRRHLSALLAMYRGEGTRWLNFYGPAGTVPAVSYESVLASQPEALAPAFKGRVVFVGYAEVSQPEQVEHFSTAFSTGDGLDHSGVEILATAFSNLLDDKALRELSVPAWVALIFMAGLLSTVACKLLSVRKAAIAVVASLAAFGAGTLYVFSTEGFWIAYMMPMFVAAPAGMLTAFTWTYRTTWRQRENLRGALEQFIPRDLANQFEANVESLPRTRESLECGCVGTDAANYTPLAEGMAPDQLADFLNQYFEALFRPVGVHGGFVSDVVGDAMLALWPQRSPDALEALLRAVLQMRDAARHFNEHHAQGRLLTRFGVDWGPVTLGTMGALRRYEYRAVGDTVNTATRIQELNKKLGTVVLVSKRSLPQATDEFLVRDVGRFQLRGKKIPVELCELVGLVSAATPSEIELCRQFSDCRRIAYEENAAAALSAFRHLQQQYPTDGPTLFYLTALQAGRGPADGVFKVD